MNRTPRILAATVLLAIITTVLIGCRGGPKQVPSPTGAGPSAASPKAPPTGAQSPDVSQNTPTTGAEPPAVSVETPTTGAPPATAPQKPPKQPVVMPSDEGEGVITFATYAFLQDAYEPVLAEFRRQYPAITVQVRVLDYSWTPRQMASAADTTLISYQAANSGAYFLDLTPLEELDPAFDPHSYWSGILDACQDAEGRIYGLPVFVEPTGIYFSEKAFDAAGLPYPQPGWTWEDFQKAVNALAGTQGGLPVYGFADDSFLDTPDETLLSPRISYLLDQTGGEIDPELFTGDLQWYLGLVKLGSLYSENIYPQQSPARAPDAVKAWSTAWNELWGTSHEMFLKNPPAMWKGRLDQVYWGNLNMEALPNGSLNMGGTADSLIKSKPDIGWVPFPVSADGQNDQTTPNVVTCAVISAGSQHPRLAWTWLNFLAAHPILPDWSLAVPSVKSAVEASGYWGKLPSKFREAVLFSADHGWYSNPYPEAVLAVNQALLKAVSQNADLRTALEEAGAQLEAAVPPTPDLTPVAVAPPEPTVPLSEIPIEYFSPLFSERIEALAEQFNQQNPDVTVNVSYDAAGGVAGLAEKYDCFAWLPEAGLPVDMLQDLDQYLAAGGTSIRDDYTKPELDEFSQDGKLFGLPTAYRPNLIYYNADLLAQRGLKPPAADWTYADLIELVNAAASGSPAKPVYGFALEYATADTDIFLAGQNVSLVDASGDAPAFLFDAPETRQAVQWLAAQVKSGVILPVTPSTIGTHASNYAEVRQLILDGRVAFWVSWLDLRGQGGSYSLKDAKFHIGMAPIPLPGGTSTWRPTQAALGQYISRKALNPDGCWAWIKFLSEQPENSFGIPARHSVRQSDAWVTQVGAGAAKVYQAAVEGRRMLSQENVYALGSTRIWWDAALAEIVSGADPLPLLAELQGKADAYSACLAASSDYQTGNAQQKTQADNTCFNQASP